MRMKGKRLIGAISFLTAIFAAFTLNSKAVADLVIDRDDNMTNYVVKEKDGPLEISLSDNAGKPLIGAEIVIQDQSSISIFWKQENIGLRLNQENLEEHWNGMLRLKRKI